MKKLRVILPAILTLAVSTSAAVTGTVAWFTASRLRTVEMDNIAVVDPEDGLNLEKVVANAGCIVDTTTVNAQGVPLENKTPMIHQGQYNDSGVKQGFFRDGSVDLSVSTPLVYKADLKDDGTYTTYSTVDSPYADTNKTYQDKKVFHATKYTLTFSVDEYTSDVYTQSLFLDLDASTATKPTKQSDGSTDATDPDLTLYNAVRFGFRSSKNQWFVWAPFSTLTTGNEGTATYISAGAVAHHQDTDFTKGNNTAAAQANATLTEGANGYIEKATGEGYIGYLGALEEYDANDLASKPGTTVEVYTWFEGSDPACESLNFEHLLKGLTSNLKFVMRKVKTTA